MKKIALVTGVTSQNGTYLAEFPLKQKQDTRDERRTSLFNTDRVLINKLCIQELNWELYGNPKIILTGGVKPF